jgi:hypothetical protein
MLEDQQISIEAGLKHTSTWSFVHESMLSDLTFEMWVPNFRCMAAHRMHRKIPSYIVLALVESYNFPCGAYRDQLTLQLAQPKVHIRFRISQTRVRRVDLPGFLAPQSAHVELPGTFLTRSCNARSLRACWRLLNVAAMMRCVSGVLVCV